MRVLAIDHGLARVGVAISDPSGTLARPLDVIEPDLDAVAKLAASEGAGLVVVGVPVSLDGGEGEQAAAARAFAAALADRCTLPVDTYGERRTTRMADASARAGATAPTDALAAAHLLESFLESRRGEPSQ
jgi:putative pre-16S rRNA nuclease